MTSDYSSIGFSIPIAAVRPVPIAVNSPIAGSSAPNRARVSAAVIAAELTRLTGVLDAEVEKWGKVPAARANPALPFVTMIAQKAEIPRWTISTGAGRHREVLMDYVRRHGLIVCDEGGKGRTFERSDAMHERVKRYLADRERSGLGIPTIAGKPNMRAIARGAGIGVKTLIHKRHRSRALVFDELKRLGTGPERAPGALTLGNILKLLEAA
ncbi:hypothetical protein [Bradyrhizobium sp. WSM471]|uniref:hypothetical protein n=1 Tax=Bradyrhizobium sp. WSM471 TaxID=319017 RepID=UPI00024D1AB4|nr:MULTISPECIES: hypothetical protein [Bradyrhizobium]EHR00191.1 hypothetical protein Bra471DRAFT_00737 [Bradyrhizobium sp. WSM471]UFW42311.1 hypothetical protein BcanWSM471_03625 [Bradyrhizobium canariense]